MPPMTADSTYAGRRGPEEIALESWLEDSDLYVSLRETRGPRKRPSGFRTQTLLKPESRQS